jgi:hypothetical protein
MGNFFGVYTLLIDNHAQASDPAKETIMAQT